MRSVILIGLAATGTLMAGCATTQDERAYSCYRDNTVARARESTAPQILTYDPRTRVETRTDVTPNGDISVSAVSRTGTIRGQVNNSGASVEARADGTSGAVAIKEDTYKMAATNLADSSAIGVSGDLNKGKDKSCEVRGSSSGSGWWPWGGNRRSSLSTTANN